MEAILYVNLRVSSGNPPGDCFAVYPIGCGLVCIPSLHRNSKGNTSFYYVYSCLTPLPIPASEPESAFSPLLIQSAKILVSERSLLYLPTITVPISPPLFIIIQGGAALSIIVGAPRLLVIEGAEPPTSARVASTPVAQLLRKRSRINRRYDQCRI